MMATVLAKLYRGLKKTKSKSITAVSVHAESVCVNGLSWSSLPTEVSLETHLEDFRKYLLSLARPEWEGRALASKNFDAGTTNALFAIYEEEKGLSTPDTVLIRVNGAGTENLINRSDEIVSLLTLHNNSLSPPLYAQFKNGMCYGYILGNPLSVEDFSDPAMIKRIVKALVKMHSLEIPVSFRGREPHVWRKSSQWLKLVPTHFEEADKQKRFVSSVGSIVELEREMGEIKEVLSHAQSPIVFCHNDLTSGNLIYNKDSGEVGLIDLEYAGPNYLAFEIANHFCEFAGVHDIDFSLYPTEEVQKCWITAYLEESTGGTVSARDVHELYREVNKFVLSNHLFWTIWGIFQAQNSTIDFDYIGYAGVRYSEYKKKKDEFLAL